MEWSYEWRISILQHAFNSNPFTLFGGFGRNPFPSSRMSVGGNPFQIQWNPVQGYFPSQGMSNRGNPFQVSTTLHARVFPFTRDVDKGKPCPVLWKPNGWRIFPPLSRDLMVFIKTLAHQQTLSGNLGASNNPGYPF
jgi:hypothetical protein